MANRVGSRIPNRAAPKIIVDQIEAIPALAETELINVVAGHPKGVPLISHASHNTSAPFRDGYAVITCSSIKQWRARAKTPEVGNTVFQTKTVPNNISIAHLVSA